MTKKAKKSQQVRSRRKGTRKAKADDSQPSVVCSRSYIVSRNSYFKGTDDNEEGFPEGCSITRDDFRTIMGSRVNTPLPRIGADSKLGNMIGTPLGKIEKHEFFLPDISSHLSGRMTRRPENHVVDIDMYDVECIRKTRSGIAFTQFVGRPYRLPRLYSDGQIERHPKPRVNECASFVPIIQSDMNRSGGTFVDNLRNEVEENRQLREQKNIERMQRQLQEWEGRASRIGRSCDKSCDESRNRSCDSSEERVRAIVVEQGRLRRASFDNHVRRFMDKRH